MGVDYGTLSGRAVVVRVADGIEVGAAAHEYSSGVMDRRLRSTGEKLPADWALQDPGDCVDVLKNAVPRAMAASGVDPSRVVGIGTDFTACTVLPVLADGTPLCQLPELADRPHAYVKLGRAHAAQRYADRINQLAEQTGQPWLARYGGRVSSEWQFAKALQLLEEDPPIYERMRYWVEAADWIIWQMCGRYVRKACSAGYKGLLQDGQHPDAAFLASLNPGFADFVAGRLEHSVAALGAPAGALTEEAAAWTGLPAGITVAVGNVDAHVTAPAARTVEPGQMLAIMGTSTCHVMNGSRLREVPGMCGVVDGGIVLHAELVRYALVTWTAGNVSARIEGTDLFVIKPSGVSYDELTEQDMVVCDLGGAPIDGRTPSSDTAAHAYVYREMPEVGGVVHTHSTYATPGRHGVSRSRACSPRGPMSSAATSRSAHSHGSGTIPSDGASCRPSAATGPRRC